MLKMKWTMANDSRLVATWNGRNHSYIAPSYLTAETAGHMAGATTTFAKARTSAQAARVWKWLTGRPTA